jgi:Anaphase-promoting complex subunit 4 WD40 domain
MTDHLHPPFEADEVRMALRLRGFANRAVAPFDPDEVSRQAIAAGGRRVTPSMRWVPSSTFGRLGAVAALLAVALIGGTLAAGALTKPPSLPGVVVSTGSPVPVMSGLLPTPSPEVVPTSAPTSMPSASSPAVACIPASYEVVAGRGKAPSPDTRPALEPEGFGEVAMTIMGDNTWELYVGNAHAPIRQAAYGSGGLSRVVDWSVNRRVLLVAVQSQSGPPSLLRDCAGLAIVRGDGSAVVTLASGSAPGVRAAAVSPDGGLVAWTSPSASGSWDLTVADSSGDVQVAGAVPCTAPTPGFIDQPLSWSPDGRTLAVNCGAGAVSLVGVTDGSVRNVSAAGATEVIAMRWQVDSSNLLLARVKVHGMTIEAINPANGSTGSAIEVDRVGTWTSASFSPHARWLLAEAGAQWPFLGYVIDVATGRTTPIDGCAGGVDCQWASDDAIAIPMDLQPTQLVGVPAGRSIATWDLNGGVLTLLP